jgi:hypothetical protein
MNCAHIEELLSDYMEHSLPDQDMTQVAIHLSKCPNCSRLRDGMVSAIYLCKNYPVLEMDASLVEKILLRTSGRPRRRSLKELWTAFFLKPLLTPRFAVGAGLAALFLVLTVNLIVPRISPALSAFSLSELLRLMDKGVQQVYGEGLKAYKTKTDLEEQFAYLKSNIFGKLRFIMGKIDAPAEDSGKSAPPGGQKKAPEEKSSSLLLLPA